MSTTTEILYLFGFSSRTSNQLTNLIPLLKSQISKGSKIGIALMHDGVIGVSSKGKIPDSMKDLLSLDISIHALEPDMKARGISPDQINEKIQGISYGQLVDLMESSSKLISWL